MDYYLDEVLALVFQHQELQELQVLQVLHPLLKSVVLMQLVRSQQLLPLHVRP